MQIHLTTLHALLPCFLHYTSTLQAGTCRVVRVCYFTCCLGDSTQTTGTHQNHHRCQTFNCGTTTIRVFFCQDVYMTDFSFFWSWSFHTGSQWFLGFLGDIHKKFTSKQQDSYAKSYDHILTNGIWKFSWDHCSALSKNTKQPPTDSDQLLTC
jgi:hypothetical protein